jgi:hypothetical protein
MSDGKTNKLRAGLFILFNYYKNQIEDYTYPNSMCKNTYPD